jgi:predicted GIY-YIG superfamily endonuclease
MIIYLYHLIANDQVVYVGLTKNPTKRKAAHHRSKPPHTFVIIDQYADAYDASTAERKYISEYNTYKDFSKWNKDPGGNYAESSGFDRKGIRCGVKKGNVPWNKGLTKTDPRVQKNGIKAAVTKKQNGFYETCGKYLPTKTGNDHYMTRPEHKERMSKLASSRYRIYREDGTWYWGYRS